MSDALREERRRGHDPCTSRPTLQRTARDSSHKLSNTSHDDLLLGVLPGLAKTRLGERVPWPSDARADLRSITSLV